MREIKAPQDPDIEFRIFLAGSIEMGSAEPWQEKIVAAVSPDSRFVFLNPRRDDWDSSWKQSINDPQFNMQVSWELNMLDAADLIIMYFDPNTKSPISLLELGLHANSRKLVVCCPEGFWRKGNVEMVCDRYKIQLLDSFDKLVELVRQLDKIAK